MKYNGAKAIIDLYNPAVKQNQISLAQIWIEAGPPAELNGIQVGWAVSYHIQIKILFIFTIVLLTIHLGCIICLFSIWKLISALRIIMIYKLINMP